MRKDYEERLEKYIKVITLTIASKYNMADFLLAGFIFITHRKITIKICFRIK